MKEIAGRGRLCLALVLCASLAAVGSAQTSAPAGEKGAKLTAEAAALDARVEALATELRELEQALAEATPGVRLIYADRVHDTSADLRVVVADLIRNIAARDELGLQTAAARSRVEALLRAEALALRQELERTRRRTLELIDRLAAAAVDDMPDLADQLADATSSATGMLRALNVSCTHLAQLGLETTDERGYLVAYLKRRADYLVGFIHVTDRRIEHARERLTANKDDASAKALRDVLRRLRSASVGALSATVGLMDDQGIEDTRYSAILLEETGSFGEGEVDAAAARTLGERWLRHAREWLTANLPQLAVNVVLVALLLFVFRILAGFAGRLTERAIDASSLDMSQLLRNFAVRSASRAVMLVGLLVALSQLGIELGPMLAGLGIAGFVIGFALQDTLGNFAAGMMILLYRPYDVGDVIDAGGVKGKVSHQSLVSTTIRTFDNQAVIVPNGKIWGDVITNVTAETTRRVDMVFGIGYGDDIGRAEQVLRDIVTSHELVLEDPAPQVKLHSLGDSSVDFVVRPWTRTDDYWTVYWDVTRAVKERFDADGISIPFPQRDIHVYHETVEDTAGSA